MRVLVTGGTSLVGREVAARLRQRGDDVVLFQRHSGGDSFVEYLGDITDPAAVIAAVAGVEAVIHMAARVGVVGSREEFEDTNVWGTENVIGVARAGGVGRAVYVSSPSVAHAGRSLVGVGAAPATPELVRGYYARTKAQAERLALSASGPEFPVVAVRPHLIWGPGDTQLVGRIVDRAMSGRLATIGTGFALIDTTYVTNAADAIIAALDRAPQLAGRAFVVSNGQPRTVAEMITRIVTAAGVKPPRLKVPYRVAKAGGSVVERIWERSDRQDDPPMTSFLAEQLATAHWFDQRETQRALEWKPEVSLDEGFVHLEAWFRAAGER